MCTKVHKKLGFANGQSSPVEQLYYLQNLPFKKYFWDYWLEVTIPYPTKPIAALLIRVGMYFKTGFAFDEHGCIMPSVISCLRRNLRDQSPNTTSELDSQNYFLSMIRQVKYF